MLSPYGMVGIQARGEHRACQVCKAGMGGEARIAHVREL
jgi:hypothetical protein